MNNIKFIVLLVGKSGTGKTTICNELEEHFGWKQIASYTTRPKRTPDEVGHTFVTDKEFDQLQNICAYTEFAGHRYCATQEQVDKADIYVIDPDGVHYFMQHYMGNKMVIPIYLDASEKTIYKRMRNRGDSFIAARRRLKHDRKAFEKFSKEAPIVISAEDKLETIVSKIYETAKILAAMHGINERRNEEI